MGSCWKQSSEKLWEDALQSSCQVGQCAELFGVGFKQLTLLTNQEEVGPGNVLGVRSGAACFRRLARPAKLDGREGHASRPVWVRDLTKVAG